jgi:hypothetical protein
VKDYIGYQALSQAAMRGVVRQALRKAADLGALPGEHHFYITFRTRMPGVVMADQLKDRFPDEMTIVIQHQYWDFKVHDDRFELILRFGGVPQHLRVPFAAVSRFSDPSVGLTLQFEASPTALLAAPVAASAGDGDAADPAAGGAGESGEATVVSLDAFRRK